MTVQRQKGFTLIEAVAAFTVLTVVMMAALGVFGFGAQSADTARTRNTVLEVAQARMEVLLTGPAVAGRRNGKEANGVTWRQMVTPTEDSAAGLTLFEISVEAWMNDDDRRPVRLSTVKLGPIPQ